MSFRTNTLVHARPTAGTPLVSVLDDGKPDLHLADKTSSETMKPQRRRNYGRHTLM